MKIKLDDIPAFILKNVEGLYWSKENNLTQYVNNAKLYTLNDAKIAAERRGLIVCKAKFVPGNKPFTYFIEEDYIVLLNYEVVV